MTSGDIIQYFVVAQDTAGNVGANPSAGFTATNVNTVTTPPTTPNSYTILQLISGSRNVGVGGDHTTLTAAIAELNAKELNGPLTLTLTDATYPSETFPIVINANTGSSATNTVTINVATGVSPTISGSSAVAIIKINGANYVTIDGSNRARAPRINRSNRSDARPVDYQYERGHKFRGRRGLPVSPRRLRPRTIQLRTVSLLETRQRQRLAPF